jgi:hypothetical protein
MMRRCKLLMSAGATPHWTHSTLRILRRQITSTRPRAGFGPTTSARGFACPPTSPVTSRGWKADIALGFTEIYLHPVTGNTREFIMAFGDHVLPRLRTAGLSQPAA